MFCFTPDAGSIVGESAKVRGFWVCEAVWVTHGGGMGQQVAEWMATGEPSYDLAEADANRFYPFQTHAARTCWRAGSSNTARSTTSCIRCSRWRSRASLRLTPFHARHADLGAEFFTGAGWERPQWFEANERAARRRRRGRHARRVGRAELVADRGRRARGHARARRAVRHHPVREVRRDRARCAAVPRAHLREPDRPAGRLDGLHRDAHAARRHPSGPDDRAQRRGAVPGRDRRRQRAARPRVAAGPAPRRRACHDHRAHRARCSRSASGVRGRARSSRP